MLAIERPDRYWETHAGSALAPAGAGARYPGSAYIAMAVLGPAVGEYRLADTDPDSAADLRKAAARLAGPDRVEVVEGDGVTALVEAFSRLEPAAASTTFALIDPYQPLAPTAAGGARPSCGPCCGTGSPRSPTVPRWPPPSGSPSTATVPTVRCTSGP